MDLMQPTVREQPAPARWLRPGAAINVPQFIQEAIARDPKVTADSIAAELGRRGIDLPATLVAAWMQKLAAGVLTSAV